MVIVNRHSMRQALLCCGGLICAPGYMKGQGRANSGAFVEFFSHNASFGHVFMYFYLSGLLLVFYGFQFCVFWYFHRCVSCVVPFFFFHPCLVLMSYNLYLLLL